MKEKTKYVVGIYCLSPKMTSKAEKVSASERSDLY